MNDTLYQAVERGERVMIILHQDPSSGWYLYQHFADAYSMLKRPYARSIVELFYGHTHFQTLSIYTDNTTVPATPLHVGYIGGSVTPYTEYGPGFTVYSYNGR